MIDADVNSQVEVDLAASRRRFDESHAEPPPDPNGRPRDVQDIADDIFS